MADLSKVKIGDSTYNLKDAQARTDVATAQGAIAAEVTRATGAESALDTRVTNLEARGRFLSNYTVATGLPTTYPTIPSTATTSYTYQFKSGDYYIVGSVPASGTKYMPSGSSISAARASETEEWVWTVGKTETTASISVGDQFVFDGTNWIHIAAAKDVAWGNIVGTLADQTDLQGALDLKQDAADLKAMAFAAKAKGSTTLDTIDSITMNDVTVAGNATVTHTATTYTIPDSQKADYTPAGSLLVDSAAQGTGNKVLKGGSINVTVKDAASATSVTDITYESYTPAGTISAKSSGGTATVLTDAAFAKSNSATTGSVQIEGTVSAPAVTVTAGTEKTFATGLTGGSVASIDTSKFSGGSFTGASAASFTQGAKASFTQGSKASFSKGTAVAAAIEGVTVAVDTTDTELLVFTAAQTDNVIGHDEATFTANGDDTFTANGDDTFTANSVGTFTAAAISDGFFTANTLQSVETGTVHDTPSVSAAAPTFTGEYYINSKSNDTVLKDVEFSGTAADIKMSGAKYLKQEINSATFSGTEASLSFSGSTTAKLIPTAITYDKADASAAFSETVTPTTKTLSKTAKTIEIVSDPHNPT